MTTPGSDSDGDALFSPSAARNREVILDVLRWVLPASGLVLEIASGSGEHAVHFARALPGLTWQPSDPDPAALRSISAHARSASLGNLRPALALDAEAPLWPLEHADAVVSINMVHIAPWPAAEGLMAGAGRVLEKGGPLLLYGPFTVDGTHTAPSNSAFDASLRMRDPRWGIRDVAALEQAAAAHGMQPAERVPMPANNFCLVFRKSA
ncbi:DUF938 domain-containing protein [Methylobacterium gnaphalii]|uniref:SAM-dependent methyltransferase n=1 Tax=Methylobacterium gnaphalii TaxID=1010610 RepID=A0A512JMT3_9HYPH|nr:DUF938 domain-containing protein [Methylobacterium gnaphalii]GEP11279.1 SAM-dependent methyltransferase [Methylobacterium gnaphalii]GJD70133.1 hypothetical protein MMMDOFMJ_3075 [Methylobacterium gnaphalii]GLS49979.1 SAM-dependent methyltransferase [Methylobacterium gnaphalii]